MNQINNFNVFYQTVTSPSLYLSLKDMCIIKAPRRFRNEQNELDGVYTYMMRAYVD